MLKERGRQLSGSDWMYTHTTNYYNDTGWVDGTATPAAITSSVSTGSSSGELLYYSRTKNWKNGANPPPTVAITPRFD